MLVVQENEPAIAGRKGKIHMTTTISSKAIALAGISVLIAGSIAIVNTIAQGSLFETKKAIAELEKANAEKEKAKAELEMAQAQYLDAVNKLKGTENMAASAIAAASEQAKAQMIAAQLTATGLIKAANLNAEGLVRATTESVRAENGMFDDVLKPMFADPTKRVAVLNDQIVRLRRETESGINHKSRLMLSASDVATKTAERLFLEEEKAALTEITRKNWSDSVGLVMGSMTDSLGGLEGLYPGSRTTTVPVRRFASLEPSKD
jgi:hypothetical protein